MPHVKDYNTKKKHQKRRPHHEHEEIHDAASLVDEAQVDTLEDSEAVNTEALNEGVRAEAHSDSHSHSYQDKHADSFEAESGGAKTHLEFYGSEVIRQKAPKVMELADTVADEWIKDGQFEGLPVGNPLAQIAAAKALRAAKDVEKKLEEKGVFALAKMGLDYAKSKIQKK